MMFPNFLIYGTAFGTRKLNCVGKILIFEPKSRIVCEVIYNPNDKGIIGNLFSK